MRSLAFLCLFLFSSQSHAGRTGWGCALALASTLMGSPVLGQDGPPAPAPVPAPQAANAPAVARRPTTISPDQLKAIDRGLAYLSRTMHPSGHWNMLDPVWEGRENGSGFWRGEPFPIAQTSVAGLAFLARGHTTDTGEYQHQVNRIILFLLGEERKNGNGYYSARDPSPIFGQGYAMLFLSQVLGEIRDPVLQRQVHESLIRAVALVSQVQHSSGGWSYYIPARHVEHEGTTTVVVVQALRAIRDAGISVSQQTIDRSEQYLRKSVITDGGMSYIMDRRGLTQDGSIGLSAAGLTLFHSIGDYESPEYKNLTKYVLSRRANTPLDQLLIDRNFTYSREYNMLYLTQALYRMNEGWDTYYQELAAIALRTQDAEGSWTSEYGKAYGTGMNVLSLLVPFDYLPVFQR